MKEGKQKELESDIFNILPHHSTEDLQISQAESASLKTANPYPFDTFVLLSFIIVHDIISP